ncbi:hypothetical protein FSP39_013902 [Pinctada imbricata]|uniref:Uncharacterized protein n=1 Tax=Pinctada imbricata TaxID=66713 RepID=A0AA89BVV3_PINIB|nr:hypothetical protein FSP39_013902 [Pinctada imbricata]
MDSLKTTRLPPLDIRFEVGSIAEPPERSWARIRTCLIDNPRDDGLSRRQEVWSYHRKNRGVLKSIVRSLPSVPFRVRKGKQSHRKLRESSENGHTLPKIPHLDVKYGIRNSRFRPLGAIQKHLDLPKDNKEKIFRNTRF